MRQKNNIRKKLIIEGLIAFTIAITPILFYFYKYIPATSESEWNFLWISFTNNGYKDVATAFYFYVGKFVPLILLIVWFSTCKQWWYHVILIPIAMYGFQLYSVLSEDVKKIDENELFYLLLVCMIIIPIVYLVRVRLVDKYVHGIDLEAMEKELNILKEKANYRPTTDEELEKLKNNTLSELIDRKLSTHRLEAWFEQFQHSIKNWLNLKF